MPLSEFRFDFGTVDDEDDLDLGGYGIGAPDDSGGRLVPKEWSKATVGIESGGRTDAKNPLSSATGKGQFIESTWLDLTQRHFPELTKGRSRQEILDLRKNGPLSKRMTEIYAEENAVKLRRAGLPILPETNYLAHHFDASGAKKILTAKPGTSLESLFPEKVFKANPHLRGKTNTWAIQWARGQQSKHGASGGEDPTTPGVTPIRQRFAELEAKEPGRYKIIKKSEYENWHKEWEANQPGVGGRVASAFKGGAGMGIHGVDVTRRVLIGDEAGLAEAIARQNQADTGLSEDATAINRRVQEVAEPSQGAWGRGEYLTSLKGTFDTTVANVAEFAKDPKSYAEATAHALGTSAVPIAAMVVGGAGGSLVPVVGTTVGAIGGGFAGSASLEFGLWMQEQVSEKVAAAGGDPTKAEDVAALLAQPEVRQAIIKEAAIKGLAHAAIGAVLDRLSLGLLRVTPRTRMGRAGRKVGAGGLQVVSEGGEEMGSQIAATGDYDVASVAQEMTAAPGAAAVQTGVLSVAEKLRRQKDSADAGAEMPPGQSGPAQMPPIEVEQPAAPAAPTEPIGTLTRAVSKAAGSEPGIVEAGQMAQMDMGDGTMRPVRVQSLLDDWAKVEDEGGEVYDVPLEMLTPFASAPQVQEAPVAPEPALTPPPVETAPVAPPAVSEAPIDKVGGEPGTSALPPEQEAVRRAAMERQAEVKPAPAKRAWDKANADTFMESASEGFDIGGYEAKVVGSVASKGASGKDLDIELTPKIGREADHDFDAVIDFFQREGAEIRDASTDGVDLWQVNLPDGRVVDLFFAEAAPTAADIDATPEKSGEIRQIPADQADFPPAPTDDDLEIPDFLRRTPEKPAELGTGTDIEGEAKGPTAEPEPALKTVEQEMEEVRPAFDAFVKGKGRFEGAHKKLGISKGAYGRLLSDGVKDGRLVQTKNGGYLRAADRDARKARMDAGREAKYPATSMLIRAGGVDPDGPLAGDLRSMGITAKNAPGLFKKGGMFEADNLVASEHPLFFNDGDERGYIEPDVIREAVADEVLRDNPRLTPEKQAEIEDQADEESHARAREEIEAAIEEMGITRDREGLATKALELYATGDYHPQHAVESAAIQEVEGDGGYSTGTEPEVDEVTATFGDVEPGPVDRPIEGVSESRDEGVEQPGEAAEVVSERKSAAGGGRSQGQAPRPRSEQDKARASEPEQSAFERLEALNSEAAAEARRPNLNATTPTETYHFALAKRADEARALIKAARAEIGAGAPAGRKAYIDGVEAALNKGVGLADLIAESKPLGVNAAGESLEPKSTQIIEDFGEKIEGARKDTFTGFRDSLKDDLDVATEPLSKSFPQPDYEKLAAGGVSKRVLAHIALMRDTIPNKPRKAYKAKRWAEQVNALRDFASKLLDGEIDVATYETKAKENYLLRDLVLTADVIEDVAPADLPAAAEYRLSSGTYSMLMGERYNPPKEFWFLEGANHRLVHNPLSNETAMRYTHRDNPEDAVALAKEIVARKIEQAKESGESKRSKYSTIDVYRDRKDGGTFLGFKVRSTVIRLKAGFENPKAAREYLDENRDALQATIDEMRKGPNMRGTENRPRTGAALREGDVTPEIFDSTFGFRGVQFGNYVEGGRRQADLNRAFDALMDLADVLDVPPRALSLNGKLGLAFGARGTGGKNAASAHYEPGQVVINLTKGGGPGSLAHEWLHALDNYFAKQDDATGYISERQRSPGVRAEAFPVREPVYEAWKQVEAALKKGPFAERSAKFDEARSKPYWGTTIEKAARAFERYIVDRLGEKGAVNDYLANIDTEGGAYPTAAEMQSEGIRAAYDNLFNAIEARETDAGIELFSSIPQAPPFYSQVLRVVEGSKLARGTPGHWLGQIKNSPGVKAEELEWLGVEGWLKAHDGPVTKEALAEFIRANQIEVRDVVKGAVDEADVEAWWNDEGGARSSWMAGLGGLSYSTPPRYSELSPFEERAARERYVAEVGNFAKEGATKFSSQVLPGGKNYRELLLTLPGKKVKPAPEIKDIRLEAFTNRNGGTDYHTWVNGEPFVDIGSFQGEEASRQRVAMLWKKKHEPKNTGFTGSHYDEPNVLAHVRFNDRVDASGKKTLFIEEIQSDWHQKGRKYGYAIEEVVVGHRGARELAIPDAPFKTSWPELALKRMIRWAAENGYDSVSWTPGKVQAHRYDLSKYVRGITWAAADGEADRIVSIAPQIWFGKVTSVGVMRGGSGNEFDGKHITDVVGKDIGDKILKDRSGRLTGEGLRVGGEGMIGFYDKMLVNAANKLGKKFGAKVGTAKIEVGPDKARLREAERQGDSAAIGDAMGGREDVWSLPITEAMRDAVMQGQAVFSAVPRLKIDAKAQADLEAAITAQVRRFISKDIPLELAPVLKHEGSAAYRAENAKVADMTGVRPANIGGQALIWANGASLVRIATQDPHYDPLATGVHEPYHIVQALYQTDAERATIKKEMPRVRALAVRQLEERRGFTPEQAQKVADALPAYEAEPIAAEAYVRLRDAGEPISKTRLPRAVAMIFEKFRRLIAAVRRALTQQGYNRFEDIYEDFYQGRTGAREARSVPRSFREMASDIPRDQTATPAFRKWFGKSKVVDADGKPLVVYHGTRNGKVTDRFRRRVGDVGIHFGTAGQANDRLSYTGRSLDATDGDRLYPVYLSIENPLRWPHDAGDWNPDNMLWELREMFPADAKRIDRLQNSAQIRSYLQSKGYDGIVYLNDGEVEGAHELQAAQDEALKNLVAAQKAKGRPVNAFNEEDQKAPEYKAYFAAYETQKKFRKDNARDSWIVFEPTQIKSATGNRGSFDPGNPSILASDIPMDEAASRRAETLRRVTANPEYAAQDGTLDIENARIDSMTRELLRGNPRRLFESATDTLRRSGNPRLKDLAKRIDTYYDQREARLGQVNGAIRPHLKALGINANTLRATSTKTLKPLEEWVQHHYNDRTAEAKAIFDKMPEPMQKLITTMQRLYSDMGEANQAVGVKVYDARLGGWRPIGKIREGEFWPRMIRPDVQAVLQNPHTDPVLWSELVDALIDEGRIETREEAQRYIRNYFTDEVKNDYFAGIEKARVEPLPEAFYDYSFDAFRRYAWKWSARVSQIEQFGQVTGPKTREAFGHALDSTLDRKTQEFIKTVADGVYERRPITGFTEFMANLNIAATGLQLGNPRTATINLIGGTILTAQLQGANRVAKAYAALIKDFEKVQQIGVQYGILGKDLLNILNDTERNAGGYFEIGDNVPDFLRRFTDFTMTYGGYKPTENVVRATAMMAGWFRLQEALHAWNTKPNSLTARKHRAFMNTNRLDADKLLAENGNGPETAKYLRLMTNIPQGSYRLDMVPTFVDTPAGRFFFKYQKFLTQVSRQYHDQYLMPFLKAVNAGDTALAASYFADNVRFFSYAFIGGTAISAVATALFGYNDPGIDWDDLKKALEDGDTARMWAMIFDRAWYSLMAASAFGLLGNYLQMGLDVFDQQRVKNPLDPPAAAPIWGMVELIQRGIEQGKITARDLDQIGSRTVGFYRAYKRLGLTALNAVGSEWKEARLQAAQGDLNYIRKATRMYAEESGIAHKKTFSGRFAKTERSPMNQQIYEALLLGDGGAARAIVQEALTGKSAEEQRRLRASMQASARQRQPITIAGGGSERERAAFLRWAREHLSEANYQRVLDTHRRYRSAAARARLMGE